MVGGVLAGWTLDAIGRKSTLVLAAVWNLIGWTAFILAGANIWRDPTGFKLLLLVGRFVTGCGLGCSMVVAPVSRVTTQLVCSRYYQSLSSFVGVYWRAV